MQSKVFFVSVLDSTEAVNLQDILSTADDVDVLMDLFSGTKNVVPILRALPVRSIVHP